MERLYFGTMKLAMCLIFLPGILSSAVELGEIFETGTEVAMVNQAATFIFTEKVFKDGTVVGFKGMFSNSSTMKFQIWHPVENNQYALVGEKEFTPPRVPAMFEIPLSPAEYISVANGDLLGFAKMTLANCVVTQFDGSLSMGVVYSPDVDVDSLKLMDLVTFDPTPLPLKFSVMALYEEGTSPPSPEPEEIDSPTVEPREIMKSTFPPRPPTDGSRVYYGASIYPRDSVFDQVSQATFLLPVGLLPTGQLVKFFTYVKRKEAVLLQVWREVSNGVSFKLIGQYHFTPNATGPAEIILDEKDYISTQLGDCLGFTQIESSSSIGYNFNSDMDDGLRPIVASDGKAPSHGVVKDFTALGVPYDFALGAMVDTDYSVAPEPEPLPMRPSADHELIVPREPGELVLSQSLVSNLSSLDSEASQTYLMESLEFPESAFVTAFTVYAINNGLIQFQIWRRIIHSMNLFELVGKQDYVIASAPGLRTIRLADSEHIPVRAGDFVGFVNPGDAGVIGYVFDQQMSGSALYTSRPDAGVSVGQKEAFDILAFPYKFSVAVNYIRRNSNDDILEINRFDDIARPSSPTSTGLGWMQIPDGEKQISQAMQPTTSAISRKASQTYIVATVKFPEGGRATSVSAYVVNQGIIQFQIWRQLTVNSFKLVGSQNVTVDSGPQFITVKFRQEINVQAGDMVGYVNANSKGIIGYKFEESTIGLAVYISPAFLSLSPGHEGAFDLIRLPYKFSLAATYRPDEPADLTFSNSSGTILRGRATSGSNNFNPDVIDESQSGLLPENEPSAIESTTSGIISRSTELPSGLFSTTSGKEENNENDIHPSGEKRTTPSDDYYIPKRKAGQSEQENIPAALKPLTNVYLILIMLLWLIVVTLILIGCFVFWLYNKKKTGRPFNYYSYRSSSVPSLTGSTDSKEQGSLARFYNATGLLGGPGFPDSRFDRSSRVASSLNGGDGTYL